MKQNDNSLISQEQDRNILSEKRSPDHTLVNKCFGFQLPQWYPPYRKPLPIALNWTSKLACHLFTK